MPRIKNINEERLINAIKTGQFTRRRNPSPIRYYSLTQALSKINNHKLAKELAFVLSTQTYYRFATTDRYMLAYNILPLKNWDEIAVVQIEKKVSKFKDIVCVNLKEYTDEFRVTYPVFMKLVLSELNQLRRQ